MKFSCDQCKTKYSIADERVRGKVLKIRCKHCSNIITVREEAQSETSEKGALERAMYKALSDPPATVLGSSDSTLIGGPDLLQSTSTPRDSEEWHFSLEGATSGPLDLAALVTRLLAERAKDREVFVWRDGFDGWLLPEEVAEVWAAMEKLRPLRSPQQGGGGSLPAPRKERGSRPPTGPVAAVVGKPVTTQPVDRVESFEFAEDAPTLAKARTLPQALAQAQGQGITVKAVAGKATAGLLSALPAKPVESITPGGAAVLKTARAAGPAQAGPTSGKIGETAGRAGPTAGKVAETSGKVGQAAGKIGPLAGAGAQQRRPPPLPFDVGEFDAPASKPAPAEGPSSQSINVALASLPQLNLPGVAGQSRRTPEPAAFKAEKPPVQSPARPGAALMGLGEAPASGTSPKGAWERSVEFNISEPSQLIDLAALASAMPRHTTETNEAHGGSEATGDGASGPLGAEAAIGGVGRIEDLREVAVPALVAGPLDSPAAEAHGSDGPHAPVFVVAGPAPAAPNRQLKVVLSLSLTACVLLLFTVGYLLWHRGDPGPGDNAVTRTPGGKTVKDRPVEVATSVEVGQKPTIVEEATKKVPAKKLPRLPNSAAGKTQTKGNADILEKLYGEGTGTTPSLPSGMRQINPHAGGSFSENDIQDVVKKNRKSLSACYDRVLKHDESLRQARIDVQVKIGLSGLVTHVSVNSTPSNNDLSTCLQQTIRKWTFPSSDSDYETQFPLILTAS